MSACFNCVLIIRYCQQACVTPLHCPHMCDCDCQHCWKCWTLACYYWETRPDEVEKQSWFMKSFELGANWFAEVVRIAEISVTRDTNRCVPSNGVNKPSLWSRVCEYVVVGRLVRTYAYRNRSFSIIVLKEPIIGLLSHPVELSSRSVSVRSFECLPIYAWLFQMVQSPRFPD
jgi:hypothetical protein